MSISLNVVRIAAVRCAWTSRSAMRLRMAVIGTRSSPSAAAVGAGRGRGGALERARRRRRLRVVGRAAVLEPRDDVAHGDLLSLGLEDAQHAAALGRQLHGGLVGLELEEKVVGTDAVAVVLQPAEDDALRDRFTERWDADVEGHGAGQRAKAFITRSRSSAWWTLYEPVAGLAASARPT